MGKVLGIIYRTIATHLIRNGRLHKKHGTNRRSDPDTALRGALNLNIHFHMLLLDGVYIDGPHGSRTRVAKFRGFAQRAR